MIVRFCRSLMGSIANSGIIAAMLYLNHKIGQTDKGEKRHISKCVFLPHIRISDIILDKIEFQQHHLTKSLGLLTIDKD